MRLAPLAVPLALGFAAVSLASCHATNQAEQMRANFGVRGATLRLNPNPAAPSAAYFTLAAGHLPRTLTGASSSDVERIEMHQSMESGGMASMAPLERLDIPAEGEAVFAPGGRHLMLFGIKPAALAAGQLSIDLNFADGSKLPVAFAFAPAGGAAAGDAAIDDDHAH